MDRDIGYGPEANEPWYWLRTRSIWTVILVPDPKYMDRDIGYGPEVYRP